MALNRIYTDWDNWNIGQWTPERQEKFLSAWGKLSKRGMLYFLLTRGLIFALAFEIPFVLFGYWQNRAISRECGCEPPNAFLVVSPMLLLGFFLPVLFYAGGTWNAKRIAAAKASGRL